MHCGKHGSKMADVFKWKWALCIHFLFNFSYFLCTVTTLKLAEGTDDVLRYKGVRHSKSERMGGQIHEPNIVRSDVYMRQTEGPAHAGGHLSPQHLHGFQRSAGPEEGPSRTPSQRLTLDEVYAQDNSVAVPSQEKVDDFYAIVKEDNDRLKEIKENMREKSQNIIPKSVSLMDRLWSALIDGSLPEYETNLYREKNPKMLNYAETIQGYLVAGSLLEIGSGTTLIHICKLYPTITSVGAITNEIYTDRLTKISEAEGLSNLYLTQISPELLLQRMEVLQSNPQILFGNLIVSNLTALVGNLLPHEFELGLGRALSMAKRGFIMGPWTSGKDIEFFERNWATLEDLVKRACTSANMKCSTKILGQIVPGRLSQIDSNFSWATHQTVLVNIKKAKRQAGKKYCHLPSYRQKCHLKFGSEMGEKTAVFDDGGGQLSPIRSDAVSFDTLLALGAPVATRGDLLVRALREQWTIKPFHPERLVVIGDRVKSLDDLYLSQYSQEVSEDDNIKDTTNLKVSSDNHGPNERTNALLLEHRPSLIVEVNEKGDKAYFGEGKTVVETNVPPETMEYKGRARLSGTKVSVAKTQVDGVAQQWNRVYVESPTAGRKDDQQYQAMVRHWDREERPRGDPLADLESKQLDRFNQAWEREQPLPPGQSKVPHNNITETSIGESEQHGGDTVLRRDEKELKKAMGFLLGESDMKEMEAVLKHHHLHQDIPSRAKLLARFTRRGHYGEKPELTQINGDVDNTILENIILRNPRLKPRIGNVEVENIPGRNNDVPSRDNGKTRKQRKNKDLTLRFAINTPGVKTDVATLKAKGVTAKSTTVPEKIKFESNNEKLTSKRIEATSSSQHRGSQIDKPSEVHKFVNHNSKPNLIDTEPKEDAQENIEVDQKDVEEPNYNNEVSNQKGESEQMSDYNDPAPDYVGVDHYNPGEGTPREDYGNEVDHPNIPDDLPANVWQQARPASQQLNVLKLPIAKAPHDSGKEDGERDGKDENKDASKEDKGRFQQREEEEEEVLDDQEEQNDQNEEQVYDGIKVIEDDYHANYGRKLLSEDVRSTTQEKVEALHGLPNKYRRLVRHALLAKNKEKVGSQMKIEQEQVTTERRSKQSQFIESEENDQTSLGEENREDLMYDQLWSLIKNQINYSNKHQSFSVLTYGTRSQTLVGVKLARTYPAANVLSVMPRRASSSADKIRKMMDSINVNNVVLLTADFNAGLVETLSHSPDLARYQVLGLNVFEMILRLRLGFPFYLGRLLSLASTSFLQLPHSHHLKALTEYLRPHSTDNVDITDLKDLVSEALRLVGVENVSMTLLNQPESSVTLLLVHIHSMKRPVETDCATSMAYLHIRPTASVYLTNHITQMEVHLERARKAFSLHFLLEAGLRNQKPERAKFFKEYLKLSLHQDMCPLHFVWFNYSLLHRPIFSTALPLKLAIKISRLYNTQTSLKILQKEIEEGVFSFMEYGCSNSDLITALAAVHPNSSLIALVDNDAETASRIHQKGKQKELNNLLTLNTTVNEKLASKLMRSPEFLRYQYIGLEAYITLVTGVGSRYQFDLMMGQIISTSVTTFIQIPSDKIFSLAMTTFFPWSYSGKAPADGHGPQMYYLNEHPLPIYENSERKLVVESLKADVKIEVSTKVMSPPRGNSNELLPWKLIRVDVKNLTAEVNHHFDYELDGHVRKYTLRCETYNQTQYKVWLIRHEDGFIIPYGSVHVITLIALLRMGLLENIKTDFYEKFLQLPLYEDMAPWNIVFDAGNLTYIDFDSRNVTLNHLAPAAFQLIVMLLNYERTVKDFGKCNQSANVLYGINTLGRCVGSQFLGPCHDKIYPVPCGDGTCRSTYMDCLQALQALEKKKDALMDKVRLTLQRGERGLIENVAHFDVDSWKFDLNGPKLKST